MNWDFKETDQAKRSMGGAGFVELYGPNFLFIKLYGSNFLLPCLIDTPSWYTSQNVPVARCVCMF